MNHADLTRPSTDPELNAVLRQRTTRLKASLAGDFIGACRQGSFVAGDLDRDSDVDFVVAIREEVGGQRRGRPPDSARAHL